MQPVMTQTNAPPIPWKHVYRTLTKFLPLWGSMVVLFTGLGISYTLLRSDAWSARQPLLIRDEANGAVDRQGRFASQTELKAAQETILEMAKHHDVVAAALREIGPPPGKPTDGWPNTATVSRIARNSVDIRAPQGADFGSSEVIYLTVEAESRERALQFCKAMFDSLSHRLQTVRRVRADSILSELVYARQLAQQNLDEAAQQLREIEIRFGSDLGELRSLTDTISGDGTIRRVLDETQRELQTAELQLEQVTALHDLLVAGQKDPTRLLVSGGELLSTQPSLSRLKDGLIDAQLATSQLSGRYTENHPVFRSAKKAEQEIRQQMQTETGAVIRAMQPTLELNRGRVQRLRDKQQQLEQRLTRLAEARTGYAHLAAEVGHRTQLLEASEKALADAEARRSAALATNLLAELGPPRSGDSPVGPGGGLLTMGSAAAGLIFGLGVVFLVAPGPSDARYGRRWSDYLSGRRASDFADAAAPCAPPSVPVGPDPTVGVPLMDRHLPPTGQAGEAPEERSAAAVGASASQNRQPAPSDEYRPDRSNTAKNFPAVAAPTGGLERAPLPQPAPSQPTRGASYSQLAQSLSPLPIAAGDRRSQRRS